ncbi:MAG TPA: DUF2461 domain-containing protein [Luteibaculaceae bacterium]|nr:DUF2461 domain-containing protein [Luteibaculaceae bacterium]
MTTCLTPKWIHFFNELKANNSKTWFDANKNRYEEIKSEFTQFMSEFLQRIQSFDDILPVEPKKTIFRIYRDVRFSKDKTPYKTHIAAVIDRGQKWQNKCGFYIHIEPGNVFVGGGAWEPNKESLKAIRQEIDYNGDELLGIVNTPEFIETFGSMGGDKLKKAPKDYDPNHTHIEFLKHKQFLISRKFSDKDAQQPDFLDQLVQTYQRSIPFFNYFDVVFREVEERIGT